MQVEHCKFGTRVCVPEINELNGMESGGNFFDANM